MSKVEIRNGVYYKECVSCGDFFRTKKSHLERRKTCSLVCSGVDKSRRYKGENNPNFGNKGEFNPMFRGEPRITSLGYRRVYAPNHPNAKSDGYVLEHRLIMSEHIGRPLRDDEEVHHIDENRLNNDLSNLQLMTGAEHRRLHNAKKPTPKGARGRFVKREECNDGETEKRTTN